MRALIPYLDGEVEVELPEGCVIVEPNEAPTGAADGLVGAALAAPLWEGGAVAAGGTSDGGGPSFADFMAGGRKVLVIVNDATRPTPTPAMLDPIADALDAAGARFIVATGAHRAPTEEEYRFILGRHHGRFRARTTAHDARDASCLVDLGRTRNGTPILLNRAAVEADRVVVLGSVEPHYFAGYTGGRKAFLPGVAGYATIEANHRLALDPRAASLELATNPVSQDMEDALAFVPKKVFAVMAVLDKHQDLAAVTAGGLKASFEAAVDKARAIFAVGMEARADIVISVARPPMDIDLYQSQKAIDNGSLAVREGGCLILVSSCRDGVGDEAYMRLLASERRPEDVLARIKGGYKLGWHKAGKIALAATRARLMAVSELDEAPLRSAFMEKQPSIQAAIEAALAHFRASASAGRGDRPRLAVLLDGTVTVPLVE